MKLRNKKTGEITTNYDLLALQGVDIDKGINRICLQTEEGDKYAYSSLADFNADWEDYEEPKSIIGICQCLPACPSTVHIEMATEEEAEKVVEKLKAWKRLKDKGFKFDGFGEGSIDFKLDKEYSEFTYDGYDEGCEFYLNDEVQHDLDLLFGGEE